MTVRTLYTLAAFVGLGLASSTHAQTSMPSPTSTPPAVKSNQQLADEVANRLRESGVATGAKLSVTTQNGVVELAGKVVSAKQGNLIIQEAMEVSGVVKVDYTMTVMPAEKVQQASADEPSAAFQAPAAGAPQGDAQPPISQEPVPLATPPQPAYDTTGPRLPPYAWPTYAPHNNYSRVGYPQAYPYNAFPFIGPFYPFPKVPLGWRSVKLEWDDGHWYLGRLSTPHDYWRVKFW